MQKILQKHKNCYLVIVSNSRKRYAVNNVIVGKIIDFKDKYILGKN